MQAHLTTFTGSSTYAVALRECPPTPFAASDPLYARVMAWHFPPLLDRLEDKEGMTRETAACVIADMKRFLYICGTASAGTGRISPPEVIDLAWHHFIMFTREYQRFCDEHFGSYIHHTPFTRAQRAAMVSAGTERITVQRTIDRAAGLFGSLSPNWYAVAYERSGDNLVMGCADCEGSTNCGGNDPPCC